MKLTLSQAEEKLRKIRKLTALHIPATRKGIHGGDYLIDMIKEVLDERPFQTGDYVHRIDAEGVFEIVQAGQFASWVSKVGKTGTPTTPRELATLVKHELMTLV